MKREQIEFIRAMLTKKQFDYWYAYYVNDLNLEDIAEHYGVHITTVSHVLNNARRRIFNRCGGIKNVD